MILRRVVEGAGTNGNQTGHGFRLAKQLGTALRAKTAPCLLAASASNFEILHFPLYRYSIFRNKERRRISATGRPLAILAVAVTGNYRLSRTLVLDCPAEALACKFHNVLLKSKMTKLGSELERKYASTRKVEFHAIVGRIPEKELNLTRLWNAGHLELNAMFGQPTLKRHAITAIERRVVESGYCFR